MLTPANVGLKTKNRVLGFGGSHSLGIGVEIHGHAPFRRSSLNGFFDSRRNRRIMIRLEPYPSFGSDRFMILVLFYSNGR